MPLWYREAVSLYWRFPSLVWEQWSQAADISKVSAEWRTLILTVISPLPWGGTVQRNTAGGYRLMQLKHLLHFFYYSPIFCSCWTVRNKPEKYKNKMKDGQSYILNVFLIWVEIVFTVRWLLWTATGYKTECVCVW